MGYETKRIVFTILVLILIPYTCCFLSPNDTNGGGCISIKDCKCRMHKTSLRYDCEGTSLPDTATLLPTNTIWFMYKAQEMTVNLGLTNFSHLPNLKHLHISVIDINMNRKLNLSAAEANVFFPLKKLETLSINVVWELNTDMSQLFKPLTNLVKLDLSNTRRINIQSLAKSLNGFKNNNRLQYVNFWNIQTMEFASNTSLNFSDILYPLRNCRVAWLNVGYNAFQVLNPGLTKYARYLKDLIVSNNLLNDVFRHNSIVDILVHPRLSSASFKYQGFGFLRQQRPCLLDNIEKEPQPFVVEPLQSVSVTESDNTEPSTDPTLDTWKYPKLSNTLPYNSPFDPFDACLKAMEKRFCNIFEDNCTLVRQLFENSHESMCQALYARAGHYFGDIPCDFIPTFNELFDKTCAGCVVIPSTGQLKVVHLDNLNIYDEIYFHGINKNDTICFNNKTNIKVLNVSYSRDRGYPEIANFAHLNIRGLTSLRILDLTQIGLTRLRPSLCKSFPDLQVLRVSDNSIKWDKLTKDGILEHCGNIEQLQMSYNALMCIPTNTFSHLNEMKRLNLSHNMIGEFDVSIKHMSKLRWLDLSYNKLTQLPRSVMGDLDSIASQIHGNVYLKLDISRNDIMCTCQNREFIEWLLFSKHSKVKLANKPKTQCINPYSTWVQLSPKVMDDIIADCRGQLFYIAITVGVTVPLTLVVFVICIFLYRKRWWFRYQCFLGKQLWRKYKDRERLEEPFLYDLFVSYNQNDHDWVEDILQPFIEEEHGLKLCLHHRDFMLGENIAEQIISSIENSRKTLLVLSPNFLASTWCQFEMQMAQHKLFSSGKDVLLLALLKPLPEVGVSKILRTLMEHKTYVEWSEIDEYAQKLFWAKLLAAIKAPRGEPFDLHVTDDIQSNENTPLLIT